MMFRIRDSALTRVRAMRAEEVILVSISDFEDTPGAAPRTVQKPLETIRTDLDAFSAIEEEELIRHGYYRSECALGIKGKTPPIFQFDAKVATGRARQLVDGAHRRLRIVSLRDWVTWAQCPCLLVAGNLAWSITPQVTETVRTNYARLRAWSVIKRAPPQWPTRPTPAPVEVETLVPPENNGFKITRDDRIWDLRPLERKKDGKILGRTLMTRYSTISREASEAKEFGYWFETSGKTLKAWCLNWDFPMQLRKQKDPVFNVQSPVSRWELKVDVSGKAIQDPFILVMQAETTDGFIERSNWWIGMKVTAKVGYASIRILFPRGLHFRNPEFTSYPNDTPLQAIAFDGITLNSNDGQELVWMIEKPTEKWTYRVQWDW